MFFYLFSGWIESAILLRFPAEGGFFFLARFVRWFTTETMLLFVLPCK